MQISTENIYQKTEMGNEALLSRDSNVPFMLRRTLIIVDGIADVAGLHNKAPLYDDIETSLNILVQKGYIVPIDKRVEELPIKSNSATVETIKSIVPTSANTMNTRQHLLHLISMELGKKEKHCEQTTIDKLLSRLNKCDNDEAALTAGWVRCLKIINLTIDDEITVLLKQSGNRYFENYVKF